MLTYDFTTKSRLLCHYQNFLPPEINKELLRQILEDEIRFFPAKTEHDSTHHSNWRRASVSSCIPKAANETLKRKIIGLLPEISQKLDLSIPTNIDFEIQLTAHNDGDFYKPHTDQAPGRLENRQLTFVYYFNKEPKGFTGGNLVLFEPPAVIEPINNMIVFFDPSVSHAVSTIRCESREFGDSRFTLNGWVLETPEK